MPNCNFFSCAGYAGKDAESRFTSAGKKVASFSLAYSEGKDATKKTTWIPFTAWGHCADQAEYIRKGDAVVVIGARFEIQKWKDKDGLDKQKSLFVAGYGAVVAIVPKPEQKPAEITNSDDAMGDELGKPAPTPADSDLPF